MRAGFCGSFVAQWFWRLQSDTLGSSPAVADFSLFSFLPEQVEFRLNFRMISHLLYAKRDIVDQVSVLSSAVRPALSNNVQSFLVKYVG